MMEGTTITDISNIFRKIIEQTPYEVNATDPTVHVPVNDTTSKQVSKTTVGVETTWEVINSTTTTDYVPINDTTFKQVSETTTEADTPWEVIDSTTTHVPITATTDASTTKEYDWQGFYIMHGVILGILFLLLIGIIITAILKRYQLDKKIDEDEIDTVPPKDQQERHNDLNSEAPTSIAQSIVPVLVEPSSSRDSSLNKDTLHRQSNLSVHSLESQSAHPV
jgi:hypothetical protein